MKKFYIAVHLYFRCSWPKNIQYLFAIALNKYSLLHLLYNWIGRVINDILILLIDNNTHAQTIGKLINCG